jgi:4-diphosphocytidyl-2-C-methyl-D-erythritol kinase
VLAHPGIALATGRVFAALATHGRAGASVFAAPGEGATPDTWLAAIAAAGNDLEAPAIMLAPVIAQAREALSREEGCRLARMTGSGAAVFGLFNGEAAARAAASRLASANPGWWVRAATLA